MVDGNNPEKDKRTPSNCRNKWRTCPPATATPTKFYLFLLESGRRSKTSWWRLMSLPVDQKVHSPPVTLDTPDLLTLWRLSGGYGGVFLQKRTYMTPKIGVMYVLFKLKKKLPGTIQCCCCLSVSMMKCSEDNFVSDVDTAHIICVTLCDTLKKPVSFCSSSLRHLFPSGRQ